MEDSEEGRQLYRDYLCWLSVEDEIQKKLGFEQMSRGWAKGSKEFKEKILMKLPQDKLDQVVEADAQELKAHKWDIALPKILDQLGVDHSNAKAGKKSEPWKVAAACFLREKYLAPYKWIAEELGMGVVGSVQGMVCRYRKKEGNDDEWMKKLKNFT